MKELPTVQILVDNNKVQQRARIQYEGTVTLVGGAASVANTGVHANTGVTLSLKTPGGTLGAHYKWTPVTATRIDIAAVDASGAPVATDTSTLYYQIFN